MTSTVTHFLFHTLSKAARLIFRNKCLNHLVKRLTCHDPVELVERQIDPMVSYPTLREIIGSDAL